MTAVANATFRPCLVTGCLPLDTGRARKAKKYPVHRFHVNRGRLHHLLGPGKGAHMLPGLHRVRVIVLERWGLRNPLPLVSVGVTPPQGSAPDYLSPLCCLLSLIRQVAVISDVPQRQVNCEMMRQPQSIYNHCANRRLLLIGAGSSRHTPLVSRSGEGIDRVMHRSDRRAPLLMHSSCCAHVPLMPLRNTDERGSL